MIRIEDTKIDVRMPLGLVEVLDGNEPGSLVLEFDLKLNKVYFTRFEAYMGRS